MSTPTDPTENMTPFQLRCALTEARNLESTYRARCNALQQRCEEAERQIATLTGECEYQGFPDGAPVGEVFEYLLMCARGWMPAARIVGNLRAGDIARAVAEMQQRCKTLETALWNAAATIEGLAMQQAMDDFWYVPVLDGIQALLATQPAEEPIETSPETGR